MVTSITASQTTDMILQVCDAIIESKPYLTEVDSQIGDGDHGIGMAGGMKKAKEALADKGPFEDVQSVFKTTGMSMLNSMGGASGVIFGSMFFAGVKKMEPSKELDGPLFTTIMRNALEAIKDRGKAQVGDKTMVDALEPAVIAMEAGNQADLISLLEAAKDAAEKGMEASKEYVAKFGRAKSLMERAIGHQDAGATSVYIIFNTMYGYVNSL